MPEIGMPVYYSYKCPVCGEYTGIYFARQKVAYKYFICVAKFRCGHKIPVDRYEIDISGGKILNIEFTNIEYINIKEETKMIKYRMATEEEKMKEIKKALDSKSLTVFEKLQAIRSSCEDRKIFEKAEITTDSRLIYVSKIDEKVVIELKTRGNSNSTDYASLPKSALSDLIEALQEAREALE